MPLITVIQSLCVAYCISLLDSLILKHLYINEQTNRNQHFSMFHKDQVPVLPSTSKQDNNNSKDTCSIVPVNKEDKGKSQKGLLYAVELDIGTGWLILRVLLTESVVF